MPLDPHTTTVVVNPTAAAGRIGRDWPTLEPHLRSVLGDVRFALTSRGGDASRLAKEAVQSGALTVLSMGGDGTHNEVINGILAGGAAPGAITLGILPAGTGGDFRRLLLHGTDTDTSARALVNADSAPIDVGIAHYLDFEGRPGSRAFLNIASMGVSGRIVARVNGASKRLGGKATFFLATVRELLRYRPLPMRLIVDGQPSGEHTITTIAVANGRFYGGGMMVCPTARLADGQLDVAVLSAGPLRHTLALSRTIYRGEHTGSPLYRSFRGMRVETEHLAEPAWIELDGEHVGTTPARFETSPGVVRLLDPRPEAL